MRHSLLPTLRPVAPALIAAGLAILFAAAWWPQLPATTAMSFIAWGATAATIERFRGRPSLRAAVAAQLFVYLSLYMLFVGAVLHGASPWPQELSRLACGDLIASVVPMAATLRASLAAVSSGSSDAPVH